MSSSYFRKKNYYKKSSSTTTKKKRKRVDENENGKKGVFVHDMFSEQRTIQSLKDQNEWLIASIDPAMINCCIRIEARNSFVSRSILYHVYDLRKEKNVDENGKTKRKTKEEKEKEKSKNLADIFHRLTKIMLAIEPILRDCHFIIIEKQLSQNVIATRIMQHMISFVYSRNWTTGNFPLLCEFEPMLKYKVVGVPMGTKREDIKKEWAPAYALRRLEELGDKKGVNILESSRKKDDLSDTLILVDAFMNYYVLDA